MDAYLIMMNEAPLVTVAMPVYNGSLYLHQAIASILNQSFTNFEFIIIDDGSTDNSVDIINSIRATDPRIKFIARENRGFSNTVNEIIALARGKWIARMDQDDIALPNRFERQLGWIELHTADICGTWMECFGVRGGGIRSHPVDDDSIKTGLLFGSVLAHPTVMLRASLARDLKYDPQWDKAEDYELWTRAALAGLKMTNVPEVLLRYRQHPTQISHVSAMKQRALSQLVRRGYWLESRITKTLDPQGVQELLKLYEIKVDSINLKLVNATFNDLLGCISRKAQLVAMDFGKILYLKAAQLDKNASKYWAEICRAHQYPYTFRMKLMMMLSSRLNIADNPRLLLWAKSTYAFFSK